jgi:hypothetical protein
MTTNWTKTGGDSWRVTFTDPPEPTALDVWMQDSGMNFYLSAFPRPDATNVSPELRAALRRSFEPNTWVRAVLESRSENSERLPENSERLPENSARWGAAQQSRDYLLLWGALK